MTDSPRTFPAEKVGLHPRNKHRGRYDFVALIQASPTLGQYVKTNAYNEASIDFANPQAIKALNSALLKYFYNVVHWDIPAQYLCPPIPGRADYLHYMADLLASMNGSIIPTGNAVRVLDIGVGANAIYPLIGQREYGWHFVGADIDPAALENAQHVLDTNSGLSSIELRLQPSSSAIFKGLVKSDEKFDLTMCNPPFHASLHEALAGTERKLRNLGKVKASSKAPVLNFGGQAAELYCAGGEEAFVTIMVNESRQIAQQCLWFTTLISKASSLPSVYRALKNVNALQVKTIDMAQGQKKSRVVAWTFMNASQQGAWYANNLDSP
jgi:23S rRNA (adenine1618-N6)-methyltransferase